MVAQTITIDASLANGTIIPLPAYAGIEEYVILRGGLPFAASKYVALSTGGIALTTVGDTLLLNEVFAIFPQPRSVNGMTDGGFGVSQYPHTIVFKTIGASTRDANGNWLPGTITPTEKAGRMEFNSKGGIIFTSDGKQLAYSGIVYMPLPIDTVKPGVEIEILSGTEILLKGKVLQFSRGQLNARLWL